MPSFTDAAPKYAFEGVAYEAHPDISRKLLTLASGNGVIKAMTVLGKVTASGKYVPLAPGASNGSEVAAAILLKETDTTGGDKTALCLVRLATVNGAELNWGAASAPQITTAIGQLDTIFIVVIAGA